MTRHDSICLTASPGAPAAARAFVGRFVADTGGDPAALRLAVSELVSLSVRQSGTTDTIGVVVSAWDDRIRLAVSMPSATSPQVVARTPARVLEGVCDRWGIDRTETSRRAWCEVGVTEPDD